MLIENQKTENTFLITFKEFSNDLNLLRNRVFLYVSLVNEIC
jgi:hypothetical protein